jgi:hypothetical protein
MTKLAFLECPSGIAGDMCLGALVHAGVPLDYLIDQLSRLGLADEYKLWSELVHRNGQQATKVHVDLQWVYDLPAGEAPTFSKNVPSDDEKPEPDHTHPHSRHLPEILHLIEAANLPPGATEQSVAVFRRLAEAEGAVHGIPPEKVHFHEVGATDAIVDIVGTCLGLDWLGIEELYCSALPTGGGTVRAAHGVMPVPTPAVLKLWEMAHVPVYDNGIERELVTPTGAAIATTLATHFGPPAAMVLERVGLGAGTRDLPIANVLRLWIGKRQPEAPAPGEATLQTASQTVPGDGYLSSQAETIAVLETQIDDLNPQVIGYLFDRLQEVGVLDVFTQAIGMKKSRPGILLTVICPPEQMAACETILFRETTTLGIRWSLQQRSVLYREIHTVATTWGTVRVKVARQGQGGAIANVQPEYEDCAAIARRHNLPWREVHRQALQTWHGNLGV